MPPHPRGPPRRLRARASLPWLPQGSFCGTAAGYPSWYEFTSGVGELNSEKSSYVRGGQRLPNDRYRTPNVMGSFGSPAERVVLQPNDAVPRFEAPDYPGLVTLTESQADPDDIVNAISWQSKQPGYSDRVFRAVGLRGTNTTAGAAQPDVSGYVLDDMFWDGDVQWKYVGNTPVLGSTILGATVSATAVAAPVDLLDEYGRDLQLPDASSFALRVTVLARKNDGTTARDVYELVASSTAGALAVDAGANLASSNRLADNGWAVAFGADALALEITCDPDADTVAFKARVEFLSLA